MSNSYTAASGASAVGLFTLLFPLLSFLSLLNPTILVSSSSSFSPSFHFADPCDSDVCRDGPGLIESKGYPYEDHFVNTTDCFTLRLFRIPRPGAPVVFLQHGLTDSATTWIINFANNSLGFMLYDAGYDVWMGNSRGNLYSRNSTCYSPDSPPSNSIFWSFTYDELAKFDVPANVNYILETTGESNLVYIGHSQGTSQAFANFLLPEYNVASKISAFIALAPIFHLTHSKSVLLNAISDLGGDELARLVGWKEFFPSTELAKLLVPAVCEADPSLCEFPLSLLFGFDAANFDSTRLPVYMSHYPSASSVLSLSHYAQSIRGDPVTQYDFGWVGNLEHYGSIDAPVYNVSQIQGPPTYFFHGGKDLVGNLQDVQQLMSEYPADQLKESFENPNYGHVDYVWGIDAKENCYKSIIEHILPKATRDPNQIRSPRKQQQQAATKPVAALTASPSAVRVDHSGFARLIPTVIEA